MSATPQAIVLVHPGSAVGSANDQLGKSVARAEREAMAHELDGWSGHVIVIDGDFSDELPRHELFDRAIRACVDRNAAAGFLALRVYGDDNSSHMRQEDAIAAVLDEHGARLAGAAFVLTGAWWEPETSGGCVGSVLEVVRERGFTASVSDTAMLPAWSRDEEQDAEPQRHR